MNVSYGASKLFRSLKALDSTQMLNTQLNQTKFGYLIQLYQYLRQLQ